MYEDQRTGTIMDEGWISIAQAAETLASSRRVVTRWAVSGKLGEVKPGKVGRGKGMRVREASVRTLMAERSAQVEKRLAREAERKNRLDLGPRAPSTGMVNKRNLHWMLDLVRTLSDMAEETIRIDGASPLDAKDARLVFKGIGEVRDALARIRDRAFPDAKGEEGGEG